MPEVRILGGLRNLVGAASLSITGGGVREVVDRLVERVGPELAAKLFADVQATPWAPHRDLRVMVNGRSISFLDGWETPVKEDDTVTVHLAGARGVPGG
jgi:molybdopterin converting factor small subunit